MMIPAFIPAVCVHPIDFPKTKQGKTIKNYFIFIRV